MPKVKKDAVHRHFVYNEESNHSECKICNIKLKGQHATNLKNHMAVKHQEQFKEVLTINNNKENVSPVAVRKENILESIKLNCLKLITVHGRPFQIIEDQAFQNIISLAVPNNDQSKSINIQNIKSMIADKAYEIKSKISAELRNKLISLKLDSATYLDRSFIGINVQYNKNGIIQIRTLATVEVYQSQTGEFLKQTLFDVLNDFKIDISQIYSITTDNGRNFKKMAKLLGGSYEAIHIEKSDSESEVEDEIRITSLDQNLNEDLVTSLSEDERFSSFAPRTMLCAAHTLQLAVKDAINCNPEIEELLQEVRNVVKALRTPTIRNVLRRANLKKPILDCPTRWSSTFNMLVRIHEIKNDGDIVTRFNETSWEAIKDLIYCLTPINDLTLKLQREQMTLGDFFIQWLTCKGHLEQSRSLFSQCLLKYMKLREKTLINTNIMLEALYLDLRLNVILSDAESEKARQLLKETIEQQKKIKRDVSDDDIETNDGEIPGCSYTQTASSSNISVAEQILRATEQQRGLERRQVMNSTDLMLKELRNHPRLPSTDNILSYWHNRPASILSELALCVLAAPATQVSVERLFSSVKYILSPLRSNLSRTMLENIMIIRSNQDLFNEKV